MSRGLFNLTQLFLVMLTIVVLVIFIVVVGEGLLGNPRCSSSVTTPRESI